MVILATEGLDDPSANQGRNRLMNVVVSKPGAKSTNECCDLIDDLQVSIEWLKRSVHLIKVNWDRQSTRRQCSCRFLVKRSPAALNEVGGST